MKISQKYHMCGYTNFRKNARQSAILVISEMFILAANRPNECSAVQRYTPQLKSIGRIPPKE